MANSETKSETRPDSRRNAPFRAKSAKPEPVAPEADPATTGKTGPPATPTGTKESKLRPDHVHLFVFVPPKMAPSKLMQAVKGKTSHRLLSNSKFLQKEFWGRHLWSSGYFVVSGRNVTDAIIEEYVKNQGVEPQDDFKISE